MAKTPRAPSTPEELRQAILARYDDLSRNLQQVGRYILDEPNEVALETLAVLAERCGVQPSAIVRFAQSFGFDGASQMQRLFRDGLVSSHAALNYNERVRTFGRAADESGASAGEDLLHEFIEGNMLAVQSVAQTVTPRDIADALKVISESTTVFLVGFRRSFPVTSYLAYSLQQTGKRTVFVSGVGGMAHQQVQTITSKDVLIAVSYQPYAQETVEAVGTAAEYGARILAITDSPVSPIAKPANVCLQVRESEIRGFRTLTASLCLAQALAIGYAFEVSRKESLKIARSSRK